MTDETKSLLLSRSLGTIVVESFLVILVTVKTIVGNCLVLLAVYRNPRLRKVYNVYVVCLAFCDLLMGILAFPTIDAALVNGVFPGGNSLCWFQAISIFCLNIVTICTLVLISIQRYFKVVRPEKHGSVFSRQRVFLSVVSIWGFAGVFCVLLGLTAHGVQFHEEYPGCVAQLDKRAVFFGILPFCLLLPFATMLYFYFKIWKFIRNHNLQMGNSNVNAEDVKLTKLLCLVLGGFVVPFIPFAATLICGHLHIELPREATFFSLVMVMGSSAVNPFIYGATNRDFRREFSKIVCILKTSSVSTGNGPWTMKVWTTTWSLARVINFKFLLQPHQKYYITQYEELGFS